MTWKSHLRHEPNLTRDCWSSCVVVTCNAERFCCPTLSLVWNWQKVACNLLHFVAWEDTGCICCRNWRGGEVVDLADPGAEGSAPVDPKVRYSCCHMLSLSMYHCNRREQRQWRQSLQHGYRPTAHRGPDRLGGGTIYFLHSYWNEVLSSKGAKTKYHSWYKNFLS
jgi:hypothetical protein